MYKRKITTFQYFVAMDPLKYPDYMYIIGS
jgi:hypothetical protein